MLYLIVLVTLLVVLAGIIAYLGDVLGAYVGRRRLSLFGWRPRRTGQLIGIGGGILIMLVTLATLAVAFRGATSVLVSAQQTAEELTRLRAEQRVLEGNIDSLQLDIAERTNELEAAQRVIDDARAQRSEALAERDAALAERDAIREEQGRLSEQVAQLQEQIAVLDASLEQSEAALGRTEQQLAAVNAELEAAQDERAAAIQELAQEMIEAARARVEAERLREEAAGVRAELDEANAELHELEAALDTSRTQLEEARASQAEAEAERRRAESDRDQAIAQAQSAEAEAEALQLTRAQLEEQVGGLQSDIAELEEAATRLTEQNTELMAQNQELEMESIALAEENERLQSNNIALQEQNDELLNSIYVLNEQITSLNDTIGELQAQVDRQARELTATQEQFASLSADTLTYRANEIIHSGVISAGEDSEILVELEELIRQANRKASERGAGQVELSSVQVSSLLEAVSDSPGDDLVVLYSPVNQFEGADLRVEIDAFENTRLLTAGQLVTSREIHLGNDIVPIAENELASELSRLNAEAAGRLQRLGLFEGVRPVAAPESLSEEGFADQLRRLSGPVVIGVVATDAIYKGGPAHLEYVIVRQ